MVVVVVMAGKINKKRKGQEKEQQHDGSEWGCRERGICGGFVAVNTTKRSEGSKLSWIKGGED